MTQEEPQADEPKTSILDELLGAAAPTSAQTVALASPEGVAESGPQASVPKAALTSAQAGSEESGPEAAAPAAAVQVVPEGEEMESNTKEWRQTLKNTKEWRETLNNWLEAIKYEVDQIGRDCERGDSDAKACRVFLERLTELAIEMDDLDLRGMGDLRGIRRDLLKKMDQLSTICSQPTMHLSPEAKVEKASASTEASSGQAEATAVPGASAGPAAAAAVQEPKGEIRKLPQDPHKFFKKVLQPTLQAGRPLDLSGSLADWVQVRMKGIRAGKQAPNYDDLRVDVKTITAAYDDLSIQCVAEHRPKHGVRLMLKVKSPNGKISQAGSHGFPLRETGCCPKHAHLYLDMLHLLAKACEHQKADLDQVRAWHDEIKTHMDFSFDED